MSTLYSSVSTLCTLRTSMHGGYSQGVIYNKWVIYNDLQWVIFRVGDCPRGNCLRSYRSARVVVSRVVDCVFLLF